jgi:hypothetical protein
MNQGFSLKSKYTRLLTCKFQCTEWKHVYHFYLAVLMFLNKFWEETWHGNFLNCFLACFFKCYTCDSTFVHNFVHLLAVQLTFEGHKFQERTLALAENSPLPTLYSSSDIRPLKMEDFRYAHEQV